MSKPSQDKALREFVIDRAENRCEYCHYPQSEALIPQQLDHIIARQHGGANTEDNLALSCAVCNRYKGPNLSSIDPQTTEITALYNPRKQIWAEHFALDTERAHISGLTPEGRATVSLLRFNDDERLGERRSLILLGNF